MNELDELRAELRRKRSRATRKVGRLRRERATDISGTRHDPRNSPGSEKRLNRIQLRAQIAKLEAFNNRGTQFVKLGNGEILAGKQAKQWQALERTQRAVGRKGESEQDKIDRLKLPSGHTVGELVNEILTKKMGAGSSRPFAEHRRTPRGVKSLAAVKQLIESEKSRLDPEYKSKSIAKSKAAAVEAFKSAGDSEGVQRVIAANDEAFYLAWNYGGLADETFTRYLAERGGGDGMELDDDMVENTNSEIRDILSWMEGLNIDKLEKGEYAIDGDELKQRNNARRQARQKARRKK